MTAQREQEYAASAILSVEQTAKYLNVSPATVRHLCHLVEGQPDRIPHFRIGTTIRIPYWALLNWIAARAGCSTPKMPTASDKPPRRRIIRSTKRRRTPARR